MYVISDDQLVTFFKSMRTRYVKIRKQKSGQPAIELTDRDKMIYDMFTFLDTHITRSKSRASTKVCIKNICFCFFNDLYVNLNSNEVFVILDSIFTM